MTTGLPRSLLAIALVVVLLVWFVGDEVGQHLAAIESWVGHFGPWAGPGFVAVFVVGSSVFVPDTVLCVAAGALFGMWRGLALAGIGILLASALQYGLSRRLLRAWIQRVLAARPRLAAIERAITIDRGRLQLLLRLAPLNPATVSYLLGAAGVPFRGFLVALPALTPHLALEVFVGHAGTHVARLAGSDRRVARLEDLAIIAGLILAVIGLAVLSRTAASAVSRAISAHARPE